MVVRPQESSESDGEMELVPNPMPSSPHARANVGQSLAGPSPSAPAGNYWDRSSGPAAFGNVSSGHMDTRADEIMHAGSRPHRGGPGRWHRRHHGRGRRHDGLLPTMLRAAARASDTVISARCAVPLIYYTAKN